MPDGPLLDTNSPMSADQARKLNETLVELNAEQMTWLSGYLAGLSNGGGSASSAQPAATPTARYSAPESR